MRVLPVLSGLNYENGKSFYAGPQKVFDAN